MLDLLLKLTHLRFQVTLVFLQSHQLLFEILHWLTLSNSSLSRWLILIICRRLIKLSFWLQIMRHSCLVGQSKERMCGANWCLLVSLLPFIHLNYGVAWYLDWMQLRSFFGACRAPTKILKIFIWGWIQYMRVLVAFHWSLLSCLRGLFVHLREFRARKHLT
jgi:hypothetical protein